MRMSPRYKKKGCQLIKPTLYLVVLTLITNVIFEVSSSCLFYIIIECHVIYIVDFISLVIILFGMGHQTGC